MSSWSTGMRDKMHKQEAQIKALVLERDSFKASVSVWSELADKRAAERDKFREGLRLIRNTALSATVKGFPLSSEWVMRRVTELLASDG